ncbi:MAG: peptidoglycan synthetase [Flavobacteriales bacterium]|nr:peptidoglycan synthetase [Flavobacteriales bacterium]|tara:strand:- start:53 stop:1417 length:1365 start_codon:yes stop_codon:yes gene_type:complete
MRIHLIAIGGSAMHNVALALHQKGYQLSGSDDEIFEPSKSRLKEAGLLPEEIGWDPDRITEDLDVVILGMHARKDNPELLRAQELGLNVVSYPEFIYQQAKDKKRVVIAGSHGKTSMTAMILHVLSKLNINCDYLVGAQLEGFHTMVKLSDAPLMIIEGDEYLSSPIDRRPKFLWYRANIAVISGIAWDHINVFPTFEDYKSQFAAFVNSISDDGSLIYYEDDEQIKSILKSQKPTFELKAYNTHPYQVEDGRTLLLDNGDKHEVEIFGKHNLQNLNAALNVCLKLGADKSDFYDAIATFKGAAKRMELIAESANSKVFKDFAHAPSKLKASVAAAKEQFPNKRLIACVELHTFSSLTKAFLDQYSGSMDMADRAMVYYNPHTIAHKGLEEISKEEVKSAFSPSDIEVFNDSSEIRKSLEAENYEDTILLLMTSGNFDGIKLDDFGKELLADQS